MPWYRLVLRGFRILLPHRCTCKCHKEWNIYGRKVNVVPVELKM